MAANAAAELEAIESLSREVLALLKARRDEGFEPEPLTIVVERFPPLGSLFGYRRIVKGGWKIAEWRWGRAAMIEGLERLRDELEAPRRAQP